MPVFKVFKYLTIEPELHRKRGRATAFVLAVTTLIVVSVGVIKFPLRLYSTGVAEPAVREVVRAGTSGFVERVAARDGQWLKAGDVILVMRSSELEAEMESTRAQLRAAEAERDKALAEEPGMVESAVQRITFHQRQIADMQDRKNRLTVRATIDGHLAAPTLHEMAGQFLPSGDAIALVMQPDELVVHAALDQQDAEPVLNYADVRTKVRFTGDIAGEWVAGKPQAGAADVDIRSALTQIAGGEAPADPQDPSKAANPLFDVMIPLTNPKDAAHPRGRFVPYQRAHVQFVLDDKPLIWQWTRRFRQLIQENAAASKWL
jgi:multidrug resistance efflux pump